jgi:hypothetical protein
VGAQRPPADRDASFGMISLIHTCTAYPMENDMSPHLPAGADTAHTDAVTVLATALDRLGARIHRDLHVESSYIDLSGAPGLAETLAGFSAYADECLAALDNPAVIDALAVSRASQAR